MFGPDGARRKRPMAGIPVTRGGGARGRLRS